MKQSSHIVKVSDRIKSRIVITIVAISAAALTWWNITAM